MGYIWQSSDFGATWTAGASSQDVISWNSISGNADGSIAIASGTRAPLAPGSSARHFIARVATASGAVTDVTIPQPFASMAASDDAHVLLAVEKGGELATDLRLWRSMDGGASWASVGASGTWAAAAMSQTGDVMAAVQQGTWTENAGGSTNSGGGIWLSTDYGLSWTQVSGLPEPFAAIAVSSSGQHMLAASHMIAADDRNRGRVYISKDGGVNWVKVLEAAYANGGGDWTSVTMSNDGQLWAATHETWLGGSTGRVTTRIDVCSGDNCEVAINWQPKSVLSDLPPGSTYQGIISSG
ncbi:hypothetical protein OEZ85_013612 [Tetradesmus obliquus]|uniref:Sortilin N-terminal domain-containing protein n=1 Tax=Tetradesmus obliquus TaxID=3088 RepID=A0ABY8URB9_TETOB|nr:hypothetical protein OEZ85_013612 [Tetradesmus obliquus]